MTTPFPFTPGQTLTAAQLNAITTLPINDQTASYVALVGDVGKRIVMNVATANTVTINNSVFAVGDTVEVLNKGAGATTVTAGAGVTINSASGLVLVQHQSGQLVALSASSFLFVLSAAGSIGVVQVKSTTKSDTFTTASTSFVDITGLSVSITPTSATNKILVVVSVSGCNDVGVTSGGFRLVRGATAILIGDAAGTRVLGQQVEPPAADRMLTLGLSVLDSPATTSATTYGVQCINSGAGTFFVNRSKVDTNSAQYFRGASSITVMEVTP